jgi:hypothetical protein
LTQEHSDFRERAQRIRSKSARPKMAARIVVLFGFGLLTLDPPYQGYEIASLLA